MAVAFNTGLELASSERRRDSTLAVSWVEASFQMCREVEDAAAADRCLVFLAREVVRSDPERGLRCSEMLRGDSFEVRMLLAKGAGERKGHLSGMLERALPKVDSVRQVRLLMQFVQGEEPLLAAKLMEGAFDRCGEDKLELFKLLLEHSIANNLVKETNDLVEDYASWSFPCRIASALMLAPRGEDKRRGKRT